MRRVTLTLIGLLWMGALASGQPGDAPAVSFDPTKFPQDWLLAKWEEAMSKVDSLVAECQYTEIDKIFKNKIIYRGSAKYLRDKVATMASLDLVKIDEKTGVPVKDAFKRIIFNGNFLYDFVPEMKMVYVHKVPQAGNGKPMNNNLLTIITGGMKASDAKQRYQLKWLDPDSTYYYLEVTAKLPEDQKEFKQARLVFLKNTFLLYQVWFVKGNENSVIWDFPKVTPNAPLKATDFSMPALEPGWRLENASALMPGKGS